MSPRALTKTFPLQLIVNEKSQNLRRLQAQRNELNAKGRAWSLLLLTWGLGWAWGALGWLWGAPARGAGAELSLSLSQCGSCGRSCSCCRSRDPTWERW